MPKNVKRLPSGRWCVRLTRRIGGKQRERQRTFARAPTRAQVAQARADLLAELETLERQHEAAHAPERTTVAAYAERWIEERARSCKPSTVDKEVSVLADFVLPSLGRMKPADVNRYSVVQMLDGWRTLTTRNGEPYAGSSLRTFWRTARQFLRDLAADMRIDDPTARVKAPSRSTSPRRERQTLTTDEIGALLRWVAEYRPHRYAEAYTLACTGMRAGELYGLRWSDIDWPAGVIHIHRAHHRGDIGTTKTGRVRAVAMPATLREALRPLRRAPGDLVFPSRRGTPRYPSAAAELLQAAADGCGISVKMGAQVLRRSLNSRLLEQGVDRAVVQSQLGHVTDRMTDAYADIHAEPKRAAVGGFDEAISAEPQRAMLGSGAGSSNVVCFRKRLRESEF